MLLARLLLMLYNTQKQYEHEYDIRFLYHPNSTKSPKTRRIIAVLVLISFSLHNAFNCWCFLNFANFKPVESLMHVTANDVAFMTTVGWIGILSTLPIVTVCTYRRVLLCIGGLLNVAAPITRYIGAVNGSESLVTFSQWMIGAAFGIIGGEFSVLASLFLLRWISSELTSLF